MESIGNIASRHLHQKGVRGKIHEHMVVDFANELLVDFWGEKATDKARVLYLKAEFLTLAVLDDNLLSLMKSKEGEYIAKINQKFDRELVKKLRFLE